MSEIIDLFTKGRLVWVQSIGFEELSFHVGVNILKPDRDILGWSPNNMNKGRGVEAWVCGDLERRQGKWLQVLTPQIHCSKRLLPILAAMHVKPIDYKDRGQLMF